MEAYLDWQSKSGGIKLNDVIEENRYVAAYETVKTGDFVKYVDNTVATAKEPPFNAIALSDGEGGTITVTENITSLSGNVFPTTWSKVSDTQYTANGFTLTTTATTNNEALSNAFDNNENTKYGFMNNSAGVEVNIACPNPLKISQMKTYITPESTSNFTSVVIKGSKNNVDWVDLCTISSYQYYLKGITLANTDFYSYYKICIGASSLSYQWYIYEIQTSGAEQKEVITNIEYKDQVKIARLPQLVKGNLFAKIWDKVSDTEYIAEDGTILTCSHAPTLNNEILSFACDGDVSTLVRIGMSNNVWYKIQLPSEQKITKMKTYILCSNAATHWNNAKIQGSNNDNDWEDLFTFTNYQQDLAEIALNNTNYYMYYRIYFTFNADTTYGFVYEWQTSEYITKEVIQ